VNNEASPRTDPRIERTRNHVLTTARRMLADGVGLPMTFATLAQEAQVSRRTLYTHWGTIDAVVRDGTLLAEPEVQTDTTGLSLRERLEEFVDRTVRAYAEPISFLALMNLLNRAVSDSSAADLLAVIRDARADEFRKDVTPISHEDYLRVIYLRMVGPILYSKIVFGSVSSTVVELTVDYGLRFLETGAE
jgi:AcrR family transcriptional regulator